LHSNIPYRLVKKVALLFIGSLVIFLISSQIPVDAIDIDLANKGLSDVDKNYFEEYSKAYIKAGKDKPLFYFSILPSHHHPNINSIVDKRLRNNVRDLQKDGVDFSNDNVTPNQTKKISFFYPCFIFNGINNQYHHFCSKFISGNWGVTITDGLQVKTKITQAFYWSISIIIVSLFISCVCSFAIIYLVSKIQIEKIVHLITMILFCIPGFWLGTLVLLNLTNDDTGWALFDLPLMTNVNADSFFSVFTLGFNKYVPIVFCICILDIAFLTKLLLSNIKQESTRVYVEVLKARGIPKNRILFHHILPNVMVPFTTLIIGSLPAAFVGSLFLEIIFNVQGLGRLFYNSIQNSDWNLAYTIVILIMIFTITIFSINDWLIKKFNVKSIV
jgi:ABC-type dipeptide/oligopeptide/nickel transport system permease component